jgi:hypothetical protein
MTIDDLRASLETSTPPSSMRGALLALWHDAKGDWDAAHRTAQDIERAEGAWVHAYLHRKEGDAGNAAYWYRRAGRPVATSAIDEEWSEIATALLLADSI